MNRLKHLVLTSLVSFALFSAYSVGSPAIRSLWVFFQWSPDPSDLGGLSTNDYTTNLVFNIYTSTNATVPVGSWPLLVSITGASLLTQGPPGVWWSNSVNVDGFTRFYVMNVSNLNGGVSPFSLVATWVPNPGQGKIGVHN